MNSTDVRTITLGHLTSLLSGFRKISESKKKKIKENHCFIGAKQIENIVERAQLTLRLKRLLEKDKIVWRLANSHKCSYESFASQLTRDNYLELKIYYEDLTLYDVHQVPSYDMYGLLGKFWFLFVAGSETKHQ